MEQKLQELLKEQGIALEPAMPPGKTVSSVIRRGWSLLFGRKGTYLYAARVERLGGLMVMPFEGLVMPDEARSATLDTTTTTNEFNFVTARPRIHELKISTHLTATPCNLAGDGLLRVYDGQIADSIIIAYLPCGCDTMWVFTEGQYLSIAWFPGVALELDVGLRSWDL